MDTLNSIEIPIFNYPNVMHHENLKAKDFATQCVRAYTEIQHAMPKTWQKAIQPYKEQIQTETAASGLSLTGTVLKILDKVSHSGLAMQSIKIEHYYFMAAYYSLLL